MNEEELLSNLPEDIQRDIRRHFFKFLNKVCVVENTFNSSLDGGCYLLVRTVDG